MISGVIRPAILGRLAAAGWLLVLLLLIRMATSGSFAEISLQWAPRSRAMLTATGLVVAGLAAALAVLLVVRPTRRMFAVSALLGLFSVPFAIALLPIHGSAAALVVIGPLIAAASWLGRRDSQRKPPDCGT